MNGTEKIFLKNCREPYNDTYHIFHKKNVNLFKDESGPKFSLRNYLISIKKGFWQPAMICLLLSGRDESFSLSLKNDRFFLKTTKKKQNGRF